MDRYTVVERTRPSGMSYLAVLDLETDLVAAFITAPTVKRMAEAFNNSTVDTDRFIWRFDSDKDQACRNIRTSEES